LSIAWRNVVHRQNIPVVAVAAEAAAAVVAAGVGDEGYERGRSLGEEVVANGSIRAGRRMREMSSSQMD
jgi:hypothetical protein